MKLTETRDKTGTEVEKTSPISYVTPVVDIHEDADGYTIEAEMPGVGKGGVAVTVENGELVFTGTRARKGERGRKIYGETQDVDYRRVFDLDPSIDTARITARMDHGILTLHLPKSADQKPRKIEIAD